MVKYSDIFHVVLKCYWDMWNFLFLSYKMMHIPLLMFLAFCQHFRVLSCVSCHFTLSRFSFSFDPLCYFMHIYIYSKIKAWGMTVTPTIKVRKFCACFLMAFSCFEFLLCSRFSRHLRSELGRNEMWTAFCLLTYYCTIYKHIQAK